MADPAASLTKNGLHSRRKARKSHPLRRIRLKKMKLLQLQLNLQPQQRLLRHLQQQPQLRVLDQQLALSRPSSIHRRLTLLRVLQISLVLSVLG